MIDGPSTQSPEPNDPSAGADTPAVRFRRTDLAPDAPPPLGPGQDAGPAASTPEDTAGETLPTDRPVIHARDAADDETTTEPAQAAEGAFARLERIVDSMIEDALPEPAPPESNAAEPDINDAHPAAADETTGHLGGETHPNETPEQDAASFEATVDDAIVRAEPEDDAVASMPNGIAEDGGTEDLGEADATLEPASDPVDPNVDDHSAHPMLNSATEESEGSASPSDLSQAPVADISADEEAGEFDQIAAELDVLSEFAASSVSATEPDALGPNDSETNAPEPDAPNIDTAAISTDQAADATGGDSNGGERAEASAGPGADPVISPVNGLHEATEEGESGDASGRALVVDRDVAETPANSADLSISPASDEPAAPRDTETAEPPPNDMAAADEPLRSAPNAIADDGSAAVRVEPSASEDEPLRSATNALVEDGSAAVQADALESEDAPLRSATNDLHDVEPPATPKPPLDPNQPLDPTGGLDPNQPLDPTGGFDPNQALDPTGGTGGVIDPGDQEAAADLDVDDQDEAEDDEWNSTALVIEDEQIEPLMHLVTQLRELAGKIDEALAEAHEFTGRQNASQKVIGFSSEILRLNQLFGLRGLYQLAGLVEFVGNGLGRAIDAVVPELVIRIRAIGSLLAQYASGLEVGMELRWPLGTLRRRVGLLLKGRDLHPDLVEWHRGEPERLLELDGVIEGAEEIPRPAEEAPRRKGGRASASGGGKAAAETSIRVPKGELDQLLSLVRQLVLNKNQLESLATGSVNRAVAAGVANQLSVRTEEYARLVEQLHAALNRTRLQPLAPVLDRYTEMIEEMSMRDKQIDLRVEGGDVRVDKFLLDGIAGPIGNVLREVVMHAIETPDDRQTFGKDPTATLAIHAVDHGTHISIDVRHDGHLPNPEDILERARASEDAPEDLGSPEREEIAVLPYRWWYSGSEAAGALDDLEAFGVSISVRDDGTTTHIRLVVPIEGAVLPVVHVEVDGSAYAVPAGSVAEIAPINDRDLGTVQQRPVFRRRDSVFPLIDGRSVFAATAGDAPGEAGNIAIVLASDETTAALRVDRVMGHQDVVVEPIGLGAAEQGPFIGGAIKNDGRVALVVDVDRLIAESREGRESAVAGA